MSDETGDLVRELARDLSPVERIARLRVGALRVLGLWAFVTLAAVASRGVTGNLTDPARMLGGFGAVLVGLWLVGFGGVVAALAASVPGRGALARAGAVLLAVGALAALGLGALLLPGDPSPAGPATLRSDVACLLMASLVAVLPALGALLYVVQAAPQRPMSILLAVGAGSVALGAFTTQLGCPDVAIRHLLVSHGLSPAFGALLFLLPLWLGFRRLRGA